MERIVNELRTLIPNYPNLRQYVGCEQCIKTLAEFFFENPHVDIKQWCEGTIQA